MQNNLSSGFYRAVLLYSSLILFSLYLFSAPALFVDQTNKAILQGSWETTQVTFEKITDGKLERSSYNSATKDDAASKIKSHIPYPLKWDFKDSTTAILHFRDDGEETTEYSLDEDQLTIGYLGAILQYQYVVSEDEVMLTTSFNYHWNQPSGRIEQIEEKWVIHLNKSK